MFFSVNYQKNIYITKYMHYIVVSNFVNLALKIVKIERNDS